jgi:hypothetical protein
MKVHGVPRRKPAEIAVEPSGNQWISVLPVPLDRKSARSSIMGAYYNPLFRNRKRGFCSGTNEAVHADIGRKKALAGPIVVIVSIVGILAIVGTIRWKEINDEPSLLPDADSEQSQVVRQPAEKPAQTEPESLSSETALVTATKAVTSEVADQQPDEPEPTSETVGAVSLGEASAEDRERHPHREQHATVDPEVLTAVESLPDEAKIIKEEGTQGLSIAPSVKVPIYYASDAPPESNITPEAPLCYRFMVSGLEEQLQKLKAKYPGLYGEAIAVVPDGSRTLIAKRLDMSRNEISYFYFTNPVHCDEHQKRRLSGTLNSADTRLLQATEQALEEQLRCRNQPDPGRAIRAMMANGFLKETDNRADGIPVLETTVDLRVFGQKVLYIEGWSWDPDGELRAPFTRGPGTAPPRFISVVLAANKIADVEYVPHTAREANGHAIRPFSRIDVNDAYYLDRDHVSITCYGSRTWP